MSEEEGEQPKHKPSKSWKRIGGGRQDRTGRERRIKTQESWLHFSQVANIHTWNF